MSKKTAEEKPVNPAPDQSGEAERDNDAHRPDGSSGTENDSSAQKHARKNGDKPG